MLGVASVVLRAAGCALEEPSPQLISFWSFDETSGTSFADGIASIDGTFVGTWSDLSTGSMVEGVGGTSVFKTGAAHGILPGGEPAHSLSSLTLSVYYQPRTALAKQVILNRGRGDAPGDFSIERLADGRLRGWHVGQDATLRFFENSDGITGTALVSGTAYRIDLSFGPDGARIYLDGTPLNAATISQNLNGWNNAEPFYVGVWNDGISGPVDGAIDHLRVWRGQLADGEIAALEAPVTITLPGGGSSDVTVAPIHMWADGRGNGEHKITDTAIGGTISSASGGTLPAFPITVDPTKYVSGASGNKGTWNVQFRNSTLGTWTRLAGGDLQFTPGTTAGDDDSEYRVSDDGGSTWSEWADLKTKVLDRSLCPGPYFLVEDYGGDDAAKLDAARNAAAAANGGTVTTLNRGTVLQDIRNHALEAKVHYLFISAKHPDAVHSLSGNSCSISNPNGQCSGWTPTQHDQIWDGTVNRDAIVNSGVRLNMIGGTWDGNSFKQALFHTSGAAPDPSSTCGTCWPGNRTTSDTFNLQFKSILKLQGKTSAQAADRALYGIYGVYFLDSAADGIRGVGAVDLIAEDLLMEGLFRGALVLDGGNIKRRSNRLLVINDANDIGSGIDDEMLTYSGTRFGDFIDVDMYCAQDFDQVIRDNSSYVHQGGEVGPGINILVRTSDTGANTPTWTFQGSTARPRGIVYYHNRNGGDGEWHRINGWAGDAPHACTFSFEDTDFITWGPPYVKHAEVFTPKAGDTWSIDLAQNVATSDAFRIELTNCTATVGPNMPSGNKTIRLFTTMKALTTTQVMVIDGLTIGTGFDLAAITLNGQRLEYRNVVHKAFQVPVFSKSARAPLNTSRYDGGAGPCRKARSRIRT